MVNALIIVSALWLGTGGAPRHPQVPAPFEVQVAPDPMNPERATWHDFELFAGRYVYLEVELEGVPTPAVLDCGAGITTVSAGFAEEVGLPEGQALQARGVGGLQSARYVRDVEVALPGLSPVKLPVAVIELSSIKKVLGRGMPVILGREFFAGSIVDIDYPNRRIAFRSAVNFEYTGSGRSIELHEIGTHWAVDGSIEGREARFVLDTGSGGSLTVFGRYVERHDLLAERTPQSIHIAGGVGGRKEVTAATLERISFAGYEFEQVPASFDPGGDDGAFSLLPGDTNSGNLLFRRFRMIFDAPHGKLHVEPGPDWEQPFPRDRTGLQLKLAGEQLEISHVSPGSPAELAGWKVGERIEAIDGVSIGTALEDWNGTHSWREGPVGTRLEVRFADGSERELVLADYF